MMSDETQPTESSAAPAAAGVTATSPARSHRRPILIAIVLLLIGVAAIFWPIALLIRTVYAALGENGATTQGGDMALVVLAIPSGSIIGIGCLVVGSTILVRARRMSRSS
jgi:hypothetical protein